MTRPARRVAIRVDSSAAIGSGHVRRCLALATRLRADSVDVCFVSRKLPGCLNHEVVAHGFELRELPEVTSVAPNPQLPALYAAWLGVSEAQDSAETLKALQSGSRPDAVVVDHYGIGLQWEEVIREVTDHLVVIEDLCDRPHDCDALINSAVETSSTSICRQIAGRRARLFLGPPYAMLREEFAAARKQVAVRSNGVQRVFVSYGGVDAEGYALRAVRAIQASAFSPLHLDIAIGSESPHLAALRACAGADLRIHLHVDSAEIARLMQSADVGLGAAGGMSWERACMGLASIVTAVVDNQEPVLRLLCEAQCALAAPAGPRFEQSVTCALDTLASQPYLLSVLSANAAKLVDGRGAMRVVRAILPSRISLRPARAEDVRPVWEWRNAEKVRVASRNQREIAWDDHRAWFERVLTSPSTALLIAESDGAPVAVVRLDRAAEEAEISIYLTPCSHGRGIGAEVLLSVEDWVRLSWRDVLRILAEVRVGNHASISIFEQTGYVRSALKFIREVERHGA